MISMNLSWGKMLTLKGKARELFKQQVNMDADTWARARGWALWKATSELAKLSDKTTVMAVEHKAVINTLLLEGI